jgi:hypothetical protein
MKTRKIKEIKTKKVKIRWLGVAVCGYSEYTTDLSQPASYPRVLDSAEYKT